MIKSILLLYIYTCSFPRHGPDMGFTIHTLCVPGTCANYTGCENNCDSLATINTNNLTIREAGPKGKGLFAGSEGYGIGDFICTYSGEVAATSTNPDKDKKSRFRMQFADRYVIEAQESSSVGKYINHGCPGSSNARTQIMISPTDIYMGIVAKRAIKPEEEIVLDYCGACLMPPSLRNASLLEFGITVCHCATCIKNPISNTRMTRPRKAAGSADSTSSVTTSTTGSPPGPTHANPAAIAPKLQSRSNSEADSIASESSSSTTTLGGQTVERPRMARVKKAPENQTKKRLISHQHPPHRQQAPEPPVASVGIVPSSVGKPMSIGSEILIPLVCLLSAQVAWNTPPDVFAAAKRIVIKTTIGAPQTTPREHGMMTLHPVDFQMYTNPVGCAAAFLTKAVKTLQPWEETLAPGVIRRLAIKYKIHDLGDTIYDLMLTTQLFKPRTRKAHELKRDLSTFPESVSYLLDKCDSDSSGSPGTVQHYPHNNCQQPQQQENARRSPASITYAHVLQASGRRNGQDPLLSPPAPTSPPPPIGHSNTSSPISSLSESSASRNAGSALLQVLHKTPIQQRPPSLGTGDMTPPQHGTKQSRMQ